MLLDKHVNRIIITKSAADIVADIPKTYSECAINVPRAFFLKKFFVKKASGKSGRRFLKRYCASGIANKVKYLQLLAEIKVEIEAKYMLYYMHSRRSVILQTAEQQSAIKKRNVGARLHKYLFSE